MGVDLSALKPGRLVVRESSQCLRPQQGYGYVRALWWLCLEDGRTAISVPPGAGQAVSEIASDVQSRQDLFDPELAERLKAPVNVALRECGLGDVDRTWADLCLACNARLLRRHKCGDCRRLTDDTIPPAEGIRLPTHCFPDGIAYGVVADGMVVSVAFSHRTGIMEDLVADPGIETAEHYRRRGYAKTAVSAVVEHVTRAGGEARYGCSPDNRASIATARSVGFVPYATSMVLSARGRTGM